MCVRKAAGHSLFYYCYPFNAYSLFYDSYEHICLMGLFSVQSTGPNPVQSKLNLKLKRNVLKVFGSFTRLDTLRFDKQITSQAVVQYLKNDEF